MRKNSGLHRVISRSCFISFFIMSGSLLAASDPTTSTLERSAIEEKYKWDLSKMYSSQEQWAAHYKKVEAMIGEFAAKTGKVGDSPKSLLEALKLRDQINIQLEKVAGFSAPRRGHEGLGEPRAVSTGPNARHEMGRGFLLVSTGVAESAGRNITRLAQAAGTQSVSTLFR